jgi:hypothetical protein
MYDIIASITARFRRAQFHRRYWLFCRNQAVLTFASVQEHLLVAGRFFLVEEERRTTIMRIATVGLAAALALTSTLALAQSGAGSAGGGSTAGSTSTGTTTGSSAGTGATGSPANSLGTNAGSAAAGANGSLNPSGIATSILRRAARPWGRAVRAQELDAECENPAGRRGSRLSGVFVSCDASLARCKSAAQ